MNTVSSPEAISPSHASHEHAVSRLYEIVKALSLTVGRGGVAHAVAELAQPSPTDRVLDVGCGPGTAVRVAARRGATAAGIDPSPTMLALGRGIGALRHTERVSWIQASAESLPLPDSSASVVWALAAPLGRQGQGP